MTDLTLKPCPFCGAKGLDIYYRFIRCHTCFSEGPVVDERDPDMCERAIEAWNRRAGESHD